MNLRSVATAITVFVALCVCAVAQEPAPPPVPGEELPAGAEALTSGPVHEAFAEPVILETQAGVVAPKPPPANITEVPPDERPEGANVAWVPGYWAWDAGRSDYIWVSGCWRVTPPGMCWVPGYWTAPAGAWEWVAGFWKVCETTQEIEYLPAPPAPIDLAPAGPAPSVDVVWVPGCWYWDQGRYVQRHGYWLRPHAGWVWVPSHYSWSPRGYIFCAGHWDYDMDRRGVLFTPVYFPPAVVARAEFAFSPSICVDLGVLKVNLFAYPRYSHYYFGDCYDDSFLRIGIYPWFECEQNHTWYDPVFVYERWNSRREGPAWEARERHEYDVRRADPTQRPPRTFSEQQVRISRMSEPQRKNFRMAQPLRTFAAARTAPMKFQRINAAERQKIAVQAREVHNFRDQRTQWESPKKGPAAVTPPSTERQPSTERPPSTERQPSRERQPSTERQASAKRQPSTERRTPEVVPPPRETRGPVTPPVETKPPAERKVGTPKETTRGTPVFVPPHEVQVREPERVKIPPSPIAPKPAQPSVPARAAPTRPTEEQSPVAAPKDTPKGDERSDGRGDGKGAGKGR